MSEQTPHQPDQPEQSGNRWESTGEPGDGTSADQTGFPPASEAPARTSRFPRGRAVSAAAVAAVLVVGAVGGFAVGRATVGDDREGPGDQQVNFQRDGDGFPGDRDLDGGGGGPGFGDDLNGGRPDFDEDFDGDDDHDGSNT